MGTVYRAHDTWLGRDVAVKLLNAGGLGEEARQRLLREARAAAQLNHPNIVAVYDVGFVQDTEGRPFIVMEWVQGETLYLRPPTALTEAVMIARQVCAALEHAHAHGVIHRDLKLENILRTPDGAVKLTDFGLARSLSTRLTAEGRVLGTVFYLAPELALGQPFDGRADLYALGVVLYELTTYRLPFNADDPIAVISQHLYAPVVPPSTYNDKLPPALEALILRLLNKQPEDRPASAAEVREALEHIAHSGERETTAVITGIGVSSPLERMARGRLVAREHEMAEATALWRRAMTGDAQALLISGEPGIGKTRFARELEALAEVSQARVFVGECYPEGGAPYAPIAPIIQVALPPLRPSPAADALPDYVLADLIALVPGLRARFSNIAPNPPLDPQAEQHRLFESVVALLTPLARQTPILLFIDDVHWADTGTLFLLRYLARRAPRLRLKLMIVLTYREVELDEARALNDVLADFTRERLATRLKLARLSREQTRQLIAAMFDETIADAIEETVHRETEGNPFFVEEVCKSLIDDQQLYCAEGQWCCAPNLAELHIPQSVRVTIQARIGKLPAPAQETLRLAAVIGREFDFQTLRAASDQDEDTLIAALESAERAQLISEAGRGRGETFAFAHALIPSTLREGVSGLRRHRLHRRVAAAIEALRPEAYHLLAFHYDEAGDEARAADYYARAGQQSAAVYANEDAVRYYSEALHPVTAPTPARFDWLTARAGVYALVGKREAQRADVEAMLALAETLNDDARRCEALLAQAEYQQQDVDLDAFWSATDRALALARRLNDPVREGRALRYLGQVYSHRGSFNQGRSALEQATLRFKEANLQGEAAACLHELSQSLRALGELAAAEAAINEALALSRAAGDRRQEAISLRRLAAIYDDQHRYAEAVQITETVLALHRKMGDRVSEALALQNLGGMKVQLGQRIEAEAYFQLAIATAEEIGSNLVLISVVSKMAWAFFMPQGEFEAALNLLDTYLARAQALNTQSMIEHYLRSKGEILLWIGQGEMGLELVRRAEQLADKHTDPMFKLITVFWQSVMHAERGEIDLARQALGPGLASQVDFKPLQAMLFYANAWIAVREGQPETLRAVLSQARAAVAIAAESNDDGALAFSLLAVAELHLALGEAELALSHSSRAQSLMTPGVLLPPRIYLGHCHARALRALGRDAEADNHLRQTYDLVRLAADKFRDPALRQGWLENVRVNRDVIADYRRRFELAAIGQTYSW